MLTFARGLLAMAVITLSLGRFRYTIDLRE